VPRHRVSIGVIIHPLNNLTCRSLAIASSQFLSAMNRIKEETCRYFVLNSRIAYAEVSTAQLMLNNMTDRNIRVRE
jgi:hypothetical protein